MRLINGTERNVWIWRDTEVSPMVRIPDWALTRCLKLRGVKFISLVDREFIRHDLMAKLYPVVPKHVGFISGTENVVYMMLEDLDDAKSAFLAFHFHWFNGSLLSAKYLRDERYLERFPDAEE